MNIIGKIEGACIHDVPGIYLVRYGWNRIVMETTVTDQKKSDKLEATHILM